MKVWYYSNYRNETYTYNLNGNRKTVDIRNRASEAVAPVSYTYKVDTNLIEDDGEYTYTYDANGNMIGKVCKNRSESWIYIYDLLNRLIEVKKDEGAGFNNVAAYTYDHNGYRVKKVGNETVYYIFDINGNIIREEGSTITDNIFILGKHFTEIEDGIRRFFITDHLGSVIMRLDETGEIIWQEDVTPFGEASGETGYEDHQAKFTGKKMDEDTGLYYFNARWYDPKLGRFMTEDPIKDGLNWYAYANNNPLKFVDPTGLEAGEPYDSSDEAAQEWADDYYEESDKNKSEYSSTIYEKDGQYYYTEPDTGKEDSTTPTENPEGTEKKGEIHTHPSSTGGSGEAGPPSLPDMIKAFFNRLFDIITYVVTPVNKNTGDVESGAELYIYSDDSGHFEKKYQRKDGEWEEREE